MKLTATASPRRLSSLVSGLRRHEGDTAVDVAKLPGADPHPPHPSPPTAGAGRDEGVDGQLNPQVDGQLDRHVDGQLDESVNAPASPVPPASHPGWVTLETGSPHATSKVMTIHLGASIDSTLCRELDAAAETVIRQGGGVTVDVAEVTAIGEVDCTSSPPCYAGGPGRTS